MLDTSHILRGYTLMKGNTLAEFINDLLTMGGPEKEFEFRGKKYMMEAQAYTPDPSLVEFVSISRHGRATRQLMPSTSLQKGPACW